MHFRLQIVNLLQNRMLTNQLELYSDEHNFVEPQLKTLA